MSLQINFDASGNPETPSFILAHRDGRIIGELSNVVDVKLHGSLKDGHDASFVVKKENNGVKTMFWDDILDFRIVLCKEWNTWFEIHVSKNESIEIEKSVELMRLGEAEMKQIRIYDTEINTENDILRDDYVNPTIFYKPENPNESLLHRLMVDKAPHYTIKHVDDSIKGIQRTFQFNDKDLDDCFTEIEDELDVLFVYDSDSDDLSNGPTVNRSVSVYDMLSYCKDCEHRGEYTVKCPECGSTNISEGYGEDTVICVDSECLSSDMTIDTDHEAVKNCYRLVAGDDLMTATIKSCNPNGSSYIWFVSDDEKHDMTEKMVKKLESYEFDYNYYQNDYVPPLQESIVDAYNEIVNKYSAYKEEIAVVDSLTGYSAIMETMWNTIDLQTFLEYEMMPSDTITDTTADKQVELLTTASLSPIAVTKLSAATLSTTNSAILGFAKLIIDRRYKVSINTSALSGTTWVGSFVVTNTSYPEDTAISGDVSVVVTEDYESYVKQKLRKRLESVSYDGSISALFELDLSSFAAELKKYGRSSLITFNDACTACIEILIEQGINNNETWANTTPNLYQELYLPYLSRQSIIQDELAVRDREINTVKDMYNQLTTVRDNIQEVMNFENYLGTDMWHDFCAYRREETYSNDNYISEGLSNADMFKNAYEFLKGAEASIKKASSYRHTVSTSMKNLMVIDDFKDLNKHFKLGNWIRVKDNDEKLYKMRLLDFEIDFNDLTDITVTFSDAVKIVDKYTQIKDVIIKTSSVVNNYNNTIQNTLQKYESLNDRVNSSENNSNKNNNNISDSVNDKVDKDGVVDSINNSIGNSLISVSKMNLKELFDALFTVSNVDIGTGVEMPDNHIYIYYEVTGDSDDSGDSGGTGGDTGGGDSGDTGTDTDGYYVYNEGVTSTEVGMFVAENVGTGSALTMEDNGCLCINKADGSSGTGGWFTYNPISLTGTPTLHILYSFVEYGSMGDLNVGLCAESTINSSGNGLNLTRTSTTEETYVEATKELYSGITNSYPYVYIKYYAPGTVGTAEIKVKKIWFTTT